MRTALFWAIMQREVVIPYRRFGTIYMSYIQGSVPFLRVTFEMGPIAFPETSVRNYHYSLRNSPARRSSHLLRGGSLKSRV